MKHYKSDFELQNDIIKGANLLANNVGSTLGPKGRNVVLHKKGASPIVTKDGVTVAEFIEAEDPFQNVAIQVLKEASRKTNSEAGDGTTTATVLARAVLVEAFKHITAGASPIEIKRGIDKAVGAIVEGLKEVASPVQTEDHIRNIATISANNDEVIGKLVAKAVMSAGKDGSLVIEESRSTETTLDLIEGFRFDSGYASSQFINNERRGAVIYEDPFILVADTKIDQVNDMLPALELIARESKPLVIVASEVEGQALAALIMNATRGTLKVAAVKAPRYGQERRNILDDLCLATSATCVRKGELELKDVQLKHFGTCKKIEIDKVGTIIVGGKGDWELIEKRIDSLKTELSQTDNLHECEVIQERITRLASGVAVIKVGAATQIEMVEKKHRIEDAVEAVKSAQEEGIVPGGGVVLIRALEKSNLDNLELTQEQSLGVQAVVNACFAPIRQMAKNAGDSEDIVVSIVQSEKDSSGFNFKTGKVGDLIEEGVIDPVKVTRCALQNACSAAGTLLTTGYAIVEGG